MKKYIPQLLLIGYLILFFLLALHPLDRATWWAENIPVLIVVSALVVSFKKFRFSNVSYLLMALFLYIHTIGGHYTFEKVPFDFFNNILNQLHLDFIFPEGRNNFDRVGHFLVGVFAYPVAELALRKKWINGIFMAIILGVFALGFWGAFYEIIEMGYAIIFGGDQAANFLGSQGDIWDAQKDMLLDILGAVVVSGLFFLRWKRKE